MAWTAPRTWADAEVPTAAMFNAHLRDNLLVLKTTRAASGQLSLLDSSTLADVGAANLTGIAHAAASASFTAGRSRFNQGASVRFVLPIGADKWTGTKGVDARGVWVEGNDLHHIDQDHATEWRYAGTIVGTPAGAQHGSVWVEGSDLHYIDESGVERYCIFAGATSVHTDGAALGGSAWVETYVHWIQESGIVEMPGHADVTHSDHSDHADHTDHGDTGPHTDHDDHSDTGSAHVDTHADHTDVGHADVHADHTDHTDHGDHGDSGAHTDYTAAHQDGTPHSDVLADSRPVAV